jgi:hypothetical protein
MRSPISPAFATILGDLFPETTYAVNEKATIRLAGLAVEAGSTFRVLVELRRLRRGIPGLGR